MSNYEVKESDLLFAKVKPWAIIPSKEEENAGYDIYACFEEDYMIVPSFNTVLIPTGIASAMNPKYYAQIEERGSTGSKGFKKSAGVIDSGYRGEWFIPICNVNIFDMIISKLTRDELVAKYGETDMDGDFYIPYKDERIFLRYEDWTESNTVIYPYSKAIAQAVIQEVPKLVVGEIDYEDLKQIPSRRGVGKLGSSTK